MKAVTSTARAAIVFALPLAAATTARAQAGRDTLLYNLALVPVNPHVSVEARMVVSSPGMISLQAPPAAGPAGTTISGVSVTTDRGVPLDVHRVGTGWTFQLAEPGAIRFRYRVDLNRRVPDGSTGSGMDTARFYAVTRSLFIAPDPTAYRKTGRPYPASLVQVIAPAGWHVFTGWQSRGDTYLPADGDDLLGATIAAAADFRFYRGTVGRAAWQLAIRGTRYFTDSSLVAAITASLGRSADLLGPVPQPLVTYTSDEGRKGRTSGSLQGKASVGLIWEPSEVLEIGRTHDLFHETLHLWFGGAMQGERWWVEGVTDYVAARLYSAWQNDPGDLAYLCYQSLRNYQAIDHNTRLTMADEARQHLAGDNTELLVYRKGMLAGLMLDAAIRQGSHGRYSLDDLSRNLLALAATRRSRNVRETEMRDAAVALGGPEAQRVWARVVTSTDLLTEDDVGGALQVVTGRAFAPPALAKGRKELVR